MAVSGYSGIKDKDSKLTIQQEQFVLGMLNGKSQTESFIAAYPKRAANLTRESINNSACKLFSMPKIKAEYERLLQEFREREKVKIGWTREQSIENLQFVIETNKRDLQRIEEISEEELTYLQDLLNKETDPKQISEIIQTMLKQRKRTRANRTNNDGIISSVSELNRMHGFNEQTINMNGTVVFEGEEELED